MLAYEPALQSKALACFLRVVQRFYEKAAAARGVSGGRTGAVTVLHRVGSGLNLNPHSHSLLLDGVYHHKDQGTLAFQALADLTDEDLAGILATFRARLQRLLERRGLLAEDDELDEPSGERPQQLALASAWAPAKASRRTEPSGSRPPTRLCVEQEGFTLHARTRIPAPRRGDLEVVARYILRPALAQDAVRWREDGLVEVSLGRAWSDGTTHIELEPLALLVRLAAARARPRSHQVRYHGVLAPNAKWRSEVVAAAPQAGGVRRCASEDPPSDEARERRLTRAELLKRCFLVEADICCGCGGRRVLLACIHTREAIRAILRHLELPPDPPPPAPPRGPPELCMDLV